MTTEFLFCRQHRANISVGI